MSEESEIGRRGPSRSMRSLTSARTVVRAERPMCLIAAGIDERRAAMGRVAREAGWQPVLCDDHESAQGAIDRWRLQMAWIDLESFDEPWRTDEGRDERIDDFSSYQSCAVASTGQRIGDMVASLRGVLLIVCGHEHDPQEEIWARQLGAWLYLPGASMVPSDEWKLLCEQALQMAGGSRNGL